MKKVLALMLASLLLLSVAACGAGGNAEPVTAEPAVEEVETAEAPEELPAEPAEEAAPEEPPAEEELVEEEPEETAVEFRFGTVEDGVYENELMGIGVRFRDVGFVEDPGELSYCYRGHENGDYVYDEEGALYDMSIGKSVYELICADYDVEDLDSWGDTMSSIYIAVSQSQDVAADLAESGLEHSLELYNSDEGNYGYYENVDGSQISAAVGDVELAGFEVEYTYYSETSKNVIRQYYMNVGQYVYVIEVTVMNNPSVELSFEDLRQAADRAFDAFYAL